MHVDIDVYGIFIVCVCTVIDDPRDDYHRTLYPYLFIYTKT